MSTFATRGGVGGAKALAAAIGEACEDVVNPCVAIVYCSPDIDSKDLQQAASLFPFPVALCTTAGQFTQDGRFDEGFVVAVLGGTRVQPAIVRDTRTNTAEASQALAGGFRRGSEEARRDGHAHSATILLADGLANTGEQIVDALRKATSPHQIIVGGAAGDNGAFVSTRVGLDERVTDTGAVALHMFGGSRWGVGLGHGLRSASERKTVTRAEGALIHEIDGRPAFEAYRDFAASRGEAITPSSVGTFMIRHELGVYFFDEIRFARAPLKVLDSGTLVCAAGIEEGSSICILDGDADSMVAAATAAAREAKKNLRGQRAAGLLVFDCVCRGLILGDDFQREIDAIAREFPGVPLAGFLTYGEIARYGGKLQGWHNSAAVVVAIPA
ncbi:MAG: FIST signal transduction protein [Polyangiales bacterium]